MEGRSVNRRHSRANRLKVKVTYEEAAQAAPVWRLQGRHNRATRWSKRSKSKKRKGSGEIEAAGGEYFGDGLGIF